MKRLSVVAVSAVAFAAFFSATVAQAEVPATGKTDTVFMRAGKGLPRFVYPKTVTVGDELKIVNQTNAKQMGPHTFSLVTPGVLPKTPSARKLCFTPNHICKAIALWHGVKGEGPPTINPVEAGEPGWDTEGNLNKDGDSWFTGSKPGASFEQQVTATAGSTIHFLCAIHPWMQGSIKVQPAS